MGRDSNIEPHSANPFKKSKFADTDQDVTIQMPHDQDPDATINFDNMYKKDKIN